MTIRHLVVYCVIICICLSVNHIITWAYKGGLVFLREYSNFGIIANGEIDFRPPFGVSVCSSTNRFCERDWLSVFRDYCIGEERCSSWHGVAVILPVQY